MIEFFKDRVIETPANYAKTLLEISPVKSQLSPINIAFLSSYTSEILNPYISVELAKKGYFSNNYFAPFNQFEQEVLNQGSDLYNKNPDVVIVHNMIEDMYSAYRSIFSLYQASAVLGTDVDHQEKVSADFFRITQEVQEGLVYIKKYNRDSKNYAALQRIETTFEAFFKRINDAQ